MKRKWLVRTALAAMLPALAIGRAEAAQTLRLQTDQRGDFILIGNTLGYECAAGTPAPTVGTVGNCGANPDDTAPDIFWSSDSPGLGQAEANDMITVAQARSTAVLTIPVGATVTHAFLYWGANAAGGDNAATLDRPGVFTQNVTAIQTYISANNTYQSVANITSTVQANGSGAYRVSGVNSVNFANLNGDGVFAGWWMVVFYELASDPPRNLALFDGLDPVNSGNPQNTTLSGFVVPPIFGTAKLGIVAFEGDNTLPGDSFSFGPAPALSNGLNSANNFFNGTRSLLGAGTFSVGDLPQLTGEAQSMSGMDIDIVDVTAKITPGQTSAPISATSTGDLYYLAGFVTSIPTYTPDFSTSQKTATDLNGGSLLQGDTLEYTVVVTNTGSDTSINTVMTDPLPMGVTYMPGTIAIIAGANAGPKTDMIADDQCEYIAATRTVRCRLGTGANGTMGGQMAVGQSTTVKFWVSVDPGVSGTIYNQASINAGGLLGAPADSTLTDGNGAGTGQPPTSVVVDECESDAQCSAPEPHCNVGATPKTCVECIMNSQCPNTMPTCDPVMNVCTCVPSGMELCDGIDNDCDGTVDEGFDLGAPCTVGLGECAVNGTTICFTPMTTSCDTEPLPPSTEVCDELDNDCDGVVDNGNPGGGDPCLSGFPGICGNGLMTCVAGMVSCVADIMPGQVPETCDATDEDCDGVYDNGFNIGEPCTVGVGACANMGIWICNGPNSSVCNAFPNPPLPEVCGDDIDNNCDGIVDEDCLDSDGDGISDTDEQQAGTDPMDADSDDDGVPDGQEPDWDQDTDGDGLINALDPDSDNDGLFDGTEMGLGCMNAATDPNANQCIPDADMGNTTTNPIDADTDNGGISDGSEDFNRNGTIDPGEGDPNDPSDDMMIIDTDGDGLSDGFETEIGSSPLDDDSDDDGVPDGQEANPAADTDGDGIPNVLDVDSDNDGLFDGTEMGYDCMDPATDITKNSCIADADMGGTTTSPLDWDTDNGGISDGSEDFNKNGTIEMGEGDPNDPTDDTNIPDTDGDGLSDEFEAEIGTNPMDADSDDDGVPDGLEPNPTQDTDGDGIINALDYDSDNDGLFDGTEMGLDCSSPGTNSGANHCIPDGDKGMTTTSPLDPDTDGGGVPDGIEDANHNGVIDSGETNPNDPVDDKPCTTDEDCGNTTSGKVCDDTAKVCIDGCRGTNGNGCPEGQACSSMDDTIGTCGPVGSSSSGMGGGGGAGAAGGAGGGGGDGGETSNGVLLSGGCVCNAGRTGSNDTPIGIGIAIAAACTAVVRRQKRRR